MTSPTDTPTPSEVVQLRPDHLYTRREVMELHDISRATFYRRLKEPDFGFAPVDTAEGPRYRAVSLSQSHRETETTPETPDLRRRETHETPDENGPDAVSGYKVSPLKAAPVSSPSHRETLSHETNLETPDECEAEPVSKIETHLARLTVSPSQTTSRETPVETASRDALARWAMEKWADAEHRCGLAEGRVAELERDKARLLAVIGDLTTEMLDLDIRLALAQGGE